MEERKSASKARTRVMCRGDEGTHGITNTSNTRRTQAGLGMKRGLKPHRQNQSTRSATRQITHHNIDRDRNARKQVHERGRNWVDNRCKRASTLSVARSRRPNRKPVRLTGNLDIGRKSGDALPKGDTEEGKDDINHEEEAGLGSEREADLKH